LQGVRFGVEKIDELLGGGIAKGRVSFIAGDSGTGKTVLALKFLHEGLRVGEKCLYIATDTHPGPLINKIGESFGWNLMSLTVMDAVPSRSLYSTVYPVRDVTAKGELRDVSELNKNVEKGELTLESLQSKLELEYKEQMFERVVIDSLTTLKRFGIEEERRNPVFAKLVRFFVEKGSTAIFTTEGDLEKIQPEIVIGNGVILLERERSNFKDLRYLRVIKNRGFKFNDERVVFEINEKGIDFHE